MYIFTVLSQELNIIIKRDYPAVFVIHDCFNKNVGEHIELPGVPILFNMRSVFPEYVLFSDKKIYGVA